MLGKGPAFMSEAARSFKATELTRGSWVIEMASGDRVAFSHLNDMLGFLSGEFGMSTERMAEKLAPFPGGLVEVGAGQRKWFTRA